MANGPIPPVIEYRYQRVDAEYPVSAPVTQADLEDLPPEASHTVEIDRDRAEILLEAIHKAMAAREADWTVEELVLGAEVFVPVDVYCRYAYDQPFAAWYGLEVTVVPGDVIAPVIPNHIRREEYLRNDTTQTDDREDC